MSTEPQDKWPHHLEKPVFDGWVCDGGADNGWRYYPEKTTSWFGYQIVVRMHTRKVNLFNDDADISTLDMPRHINTAEEAKAWAVAVWRMR